MVLSGSLLYLAGLTSLAVAYPAREPTADIVKRFDLLKSYRLENLAEYTTLTQASRQVSSKRRDVKDVVAEYVQIATLKLQEILPGATFRLVNDHYIGRNGVAHVYFQQTIDGVDVDNANFNVNILEDGTVLSFGNSFNSIVTSTLRFARRDDAKIAPLDAFRAAVKILQLPIKGAAGASITQTDDVFVVSGIEGVLEDPVVKLAYIQRDGQLTLTWRVETDIGSNLLSTYVDAISGTEVSGVYDNTYAATYEAYPWGILNPTEAPREVLIDPEDLSASPLGWHNDGNESYTTTRGNNIVPSSRTAPLPNSPPLIFSYPYSPATADYTSYIDASVTQGFYYLNKFHDILYVLGFDEAAGNMQVDNHGKGGLGNDPVHLYVQDSIGGGGVITTPTDGRIPHLYMYLWNGNPLRDGMFELTVLLHEYMHAVSARLVGGPGTAGCFPGNDGLSITEGFSDFVPTLIRIKEDDTRETHYTIADWATGQEIGLRSHYISTNEETSPLTFATLNELTGGGFDLATVWAIALYEIFWNLADEYGIGDVDDVTFDTDGVPKDARYLLLKLILDSQALTPCRPHHLQSRDALVQADEILTGGANRCAIWRGFAKRGFGTDAVRGSGTASRVNGFAVPEGC